MDKEKAQKMKQFWKHQLHPITGFPQFESYRERYNVMPIYKVPVIQKNRFSN